MAPDNPTSPGQLSGVPQSGAPQAGLDGSLSVAGLTLRQAESLLDWLEAHGLKGRELVCGPGDGFTVRWRP